MKYSHIISISVLSLIAVVGMGETGMVPYNFSLPIVGVVTVLSIVYFFDIELLSRGKGFTGGGKGLEVEPNEALNFINEKSREIPGYRPINLDRTSKKNMQLHTKKLVVNENGEKKTKFGVVGRPEDQRDKESIAYIVHCDEGHLEYDGERHGADERLNPFHGTKWVQNAGYKARVEDEKQSPTTEFNIHQGKSGEVDEG